jgi:4'-phosphopantetheinyl transferase EntD
MTDIDAIHELVTGLQRRLADTAGVKVPPAPTKKQLDAVDPALREEVQAAVEERRAELGATKTVAASVAKQAEKLERQMTADLERLLKEALLP